MVVKFQSNSNKEEIIKASREEQRSHQRPEKQGGTRSFNRTLEARGDVAMKSSI